MNKEERRINAYMNVKKQEELCNQIKVINRDKTFHSYLDRKEFSSIYRKAGVRWFDDPRKHEMFMLFSNVCNREDFTLYISQWNYLKRMSNLR